MQDAWWGGCFATSHEPFGLLEADNAISNTVCGGSLWRGSINTYVYVYVYVWGFQNMRSLFGVPTTRLLVFLDISVCIEEHQNLETSIRCIPQNVQCY